MADIAARGGPSRRSLLAGLPVALLAASGSVVAAGAFSGRSGRPPRRIVSLDYGLAETLLALGFVPVGVPDIPAYAKWVVEPALPAGVVDVGTAREANLELLQQLAPDLILVTPYLDGIKAVLERIAPTLSLPIYAADGQPYRRATAATRHLADILGIPAAGEALIARAETIFAAYRVDLARHRAQPLYFVNFIDARHLRVYGAKSLFQDVLDKMELRNAWRGETNYWGFATVGIEALAIYGGARLFYFEPLPPDALPTLAASPLWRSLSFVESGHVEGLPPVLMFGAIPAAERFARLVAERLTLAEGGRGRHG